MQSFKPRALHCAFLVPAVTAALLLFGCAAHSPQGIQSTRTVDIDESHPRATLILGSTKLIRNVVIVSPKFRKVGQLTEASVAVQNVTRNDTYDLEYRFEWEDDDGFTVDGLSVWRPFTLTPSLVKKFSATGPNPTATQIIFTVRFPHVSKMD